MKKARKSKQKIKKPTFKDVRISRNELEAIRPPQPISPLEYFGIIRVPQEDNARGRLDIRLTPYLRQPIETLGNYDIESIFVIGPTQSGKTVIAQTCVAWSMDQDPGPMLYTYPDENTAEKALEKKIVGMINTTPELKRHLRLKRAISKQNIELDSMSIDVAWSNSPATMNVLPKKRVIGDEVRLFKLQIGRESNAIKMMQDRLTTYLDLGAGQALFISSPSTEGDLLHEQLTVYGTLILKWHVPCPECGRYQILDFWENIKKQDEKGKEVKCLCKYCSGEFIDTDRKISWNNMGIYAPDDAEIDKDGNIKSKKMQEDYKRIVFWWDSLVSPFRSFQRIWDQYKETKDKIHDYKNFIQCWLANFWREEKSKATYDNLKLHKRDFYTKGEVPAGCQVLLGGIDTQDDSLYMTVYGFSHKEIWLVEEERIMADITTTDEMDLEMMILSNMTNRIFYSAGGQKWKVAMCAWDSGGHRTKEIYSVVRKLPQVIAIKGRNLQMRTVSYSKKETHWNIRTIEYLEETESRASGENFHLPENTSLEFLVQFSNRHKETVVHKRTGAPKIEWTSRGPDHFRFASAYAFTCLDVPIAKIGLLRSRLKDTTFIYNPGSRIQQIEQRKQIEQDNKNWVDDPFEIHSRIQRERGEYDY